MKDCLFCKIVKGEVPSYKVYEDENVYAFLDVANDVYGHTLVVPKKHYENLMDCPDRTLGKIMASVKKIGNHFVNDCGFEGYNTFNNNGKSAEQGIMHFHFHIIPRKANDGINISQEFGKQEKSLEEISKELYFEDEKTEKLDFSSYREECDVLYTDGACSGNPGKGGYGGVYLPKQTSNLNCQEFSGGDDNTTNNRMELMAVIEGLKLIEDKEESGLKEKGEKVKVYSDSAYVVNAFNQNWLNNWKKNGWRSSGGGEVLNIDLWKELLSLTEKREVEFVKVKGHSDNVLNNRCDALATSYYKE